MVAPLPISLDLFTVLGDSQPQGDEAYARTDKLGRVLRTAHPVYSFRKDKAQRADDDHRNAGPDALRSCHIHVMYHCSFRGFAAYGFMP